MGGQGEALHRVGLPGEARLRRAAGLLGREGVPRMGPPQEQAVGVHLRRRDVRTDRGGLQGALPRSVQRDHRVPCGGHRQERLRRMRGVRSADVQGAREELRGQAPDDARPGRCHEARRVRHVRRWRRHRVPGRRPEEAGGHPLRQHGALRRGARHGRGQGEIGGCGGSSAEDLRGGGAPHPRARVPHHRRQEHRAL